MLRTWGPWQIAEPGWSDSEPGSADWGEGGAG
jgi:hypothetical protein